jgi:hypothetical protein
MRAPIAAILAVNMLAVGPAEAQLRIAPSERAVTDQNGDSLHRCTLSVLRSKAEPIDKKRVVDEVLSDCIPILNGMPNDVLLGPKQDAHAWIDAKMAQDRRKVSALVEKLAPRAKAERAIEDQAGTNYFLCLVQHARVLALATDEAADIVTQASLSSCPAERNAVVETHRRYGDDLSEGAMTVMDRALAQNVMLEVVKVRAQRNLTPAPAPGQSLKRRQFSSTPTLAA